MELLGISAIARWSTVVRRAFGSGLLRRPIGRISDDQVDSALARLGQTRADLFTAAGARAAHRARMAGMMAAHGIDARYAAEAHWRRLKTADNYCRYCPSPERCQQWLEQPSRRDAPKVFCPNAPLFADIIKRQSAQIRATDAE